MSAGDVVLIRTGRWARRASVGPWSGKFAGLHGTCARWLKLRDVAVIGRDAASDVLPSGVEDVAMPIHQHGKAPSGLPRSHWGHEPTPSPSEEGSVA